MKSEQITEALKGYVYLVVDSQGFWPEEDEEEFKKWVELSVDDFHEDALADIRADLVTFWKLLTDDAGFDIATVMADEEYSFEELGEDLWMCRQGSGHEYDTGEEDLDRALERATELLGEVYIEIGDDGLVRHRESPKGKGALD